MVHEVGDMRCIRIEESGWTAAVFEDFLMSYQSCCPQLSSILWNMIEIMWILRRCFIIDCHVFYCPFLLDIGYSVLPVGIFISTYFSDQGMKHCYCNYSNLHPGITWQIKVTFFLFECTHRVLLFVLLLAVWFISCIHCCQRHFVAHFDPSSTSLLPA